MDLKIGSNAVRNTNGVLAFQGKEQVVLELRPDQHQLLLTMDLYNENGERVAHLRRNAWVLNQENRFAITTGPDSLTLFNPNPWIHITEQVNGENILEVTMVDPNCIAIPSGRFHTHKGQLVEISSNFCRIAGGTTLFGDVIDGRGETVKLG